jgi:hypothetical protein
MKLDEAFGDREAKAGAAMLRAAAAAFKAPENAAKLVVRDAGALVFDREHDVAAFAPA